MKVKVDQAWSDSLPVYGGVPQGSILGVMLYNITTEDLEEGLDVDTISISPLASEVGLDTNVDAPFTVNAVPSSTD